MTAESHASAAAAAIAEANSPGAGFDMPSPEAPVATPEMALAASLAGDPVPLNSAPPVAAPEIPGFEKPSIGGLEGLAPPPAPAAPTTPNAQAGEAANGFESLGYKETGDALLDGMQHMFAEKGVSNTDAWGYFEEATKAGDWSKVDMAKLGEVLGGPMQANMALQAAKMLYDSAQAEMTANKNAFMAAMGEDTWPQVHAWVTQVAAQDEAAKAQFEEIFRLVDSGPTAAAAAASQIKSMYANSTAPRNPLMVQGDSTVMGVASNALHDDNEYTSLIAEAILNKDNAAIANIQSRRKAAGKQTL